MVFPYLIDELAAASVLMARAAVYLSHRGLDDGIRDQPIEYFQLRDQEFPDRGERKFSACCG
jgi:hypothetical protein